MTIITTLGLILLCLISCSTNVIDKKMESWELEDVEKTAEKYPESFFIPSISERNGQKRGAEVRLHFTIRNSKSNEPRAERMWVEVIEIESTRGNYKGKLINQPVYIKDLNFGDEITFSSSNIARTVIKRGDPEWIDSTEKKAFVSNLCLTEGGIIRFMYREKPDRKDDSGWRMFSGLEDDEYANNPKNIKLINVGFLLDKDPTLLKPLKGGVGSVFERNDIESSWKIVEDWVPQE